SEELLRSALRAGTLSGKLTPVLCGSAKEYHGVRLLLDAVRDYLPSPADRPPVHGFVPKSKERVERKPEASEPFCALAFKTLSKKRAPLCFPRFSPADLPPGDPLATPSIKRPEPIRPFSRLMGDRRERLECAGPGEIVAVVGLKQTATGHTLAASDQPIAL